MFKIAIIEDDELLRQRLVSDVQKHERFEVVFDSGLLADSLEWFSTNTADVLLVDLGLPDGSGVDLIRRCRKNDASIEIMVVSVFGDEKNVLQAIEAGATGYLLKNEPAERICESILDLLGGGSPISPAIARMIIKRVESDPRPSAVDESLMPKLSNRETDVLRCLVAGMSYQEVADQLNIKIDTVRTYIKSIYQKLEVRNRGQAVYQASRLGIPSYH
jgi:DNA-binding NarL/FixJ family response regulator